MLFEVSVTSTLSVFVFICFEEFYDRSTYILSQTQTERYDLSNSISSYVHLIIRTVSVLLRDEVCSKNSYIK